MAILINDNYSLQACKPFDARYLNICTPWTSVSAANIAIPTYRYTGLTVNIMGTEYWYKDGIADCCLIQKSLGGTITGATNGLSTSGQNVVLGGSLTGNTTIGLNGKTLAMTDGSTNYSFSWGCVKLLASGSTAGVGHIGLCTTSGMFASLCAYSDVISLGNFSGGAFSISASSSASLYGITAISLQTSGGACLSMTANKAVLFGSNKTPYICSDGTIVNKFIQLSTSGATAIVRVSGSTVGLTGTVNIITAPSAGSISDSVLVRATDGTVKTVVGSSLGDKNNVYAKTIVTANATGTTASTYVQLISGATSFTLPSAPVTGQAFKFKDAIGTALASPVIINAGAGKTIDGPGNQCALINTDYGALELVYGATNKWFSLAFVN